MDPPRYSQQRYPRGQRAGRSRGNSYNSSQQTYPQYSHSSNTYQSNRYYSDGRNYNRRQNRRGTNDHGSQNEQHFSRQEQHSGYSSQYSAGNRNYSSLRNEHNRSSDNFSQQNRVSSRGNNSDYTYYGHHSAHGDIQRGPQSYAGVDECLLPFSATYSAASNTPPNYSSTYRNDRPTSYYIDRQKNDDNDFNDNRYDDYHEDHYQSQMPPSSSAFRRPSDSSDSDSDIEITGSELPADMPGKDDFFQNSKEKAALYLSLKDKVVQLLQRHPLGLIKTTFWDQYQMFHRESLYPQDFGLPKLKDVLQTVVDMYSNLLAISDNKVMLRRYLKESDSRGSPTVDRNMLVPPLSRRQIKKMKDRSVRIEEYKKYNEIRKQEKADRAKQSEHEESLTWETYLKHLETAEKEHILKSKNEMYKTSLQIMRRDIKAGFEKFRSEMMKNDNPDQPEITDYLINLHPEMAITEVLRKFLLVIALHHPLTMPERKRHKRLKTSIEQFLRVSRDDKMASMLMHIAICCSNLKLKNSTMKILGMPEVVISESKADNLKCDRKISRDTVLDALKKYIDKCVSQGSLNLSHLDMIEEKLCEEFDLGRFSAMGFGRFISFLVTDPAAKQLLEESCEQMMGCGSGGGETGQSRLFDVLDCIKQCQKFGRQQEEEVEGTLCEQYRVKELKHLGIGNIHKLITQSEEHNKKHSNVFSITYETVLCDEKSHRTSAPTGAVLRKSLDKKHSNVFSITYETVLCDEKSFANVSKSQVGILGHQTKESTLACLHNCPMLADLSKWSHWHLVFEPEHGGLKDFLQKYGGLKTTTVEGQKKIKTDIAVLEIQPGKLVKLVSDTSTEKFSEALEDRDALKTAGHLVSIIVSSKGIKTTPLALLSNHMKTALFSMHAEESGGVSQGEADSEAIRKDTAVTFVLECLVKLPLRICVAIAKQIFIEPLGQVVGSSKSKQLLWTYCQSFEEFRRMEELGFLLGINDWMKDFQQQCVIPDSAVQKVDRIKFEDADIPIVVETSEDSDNCDESVVEISSTESEEKGSPKKEAVVYRRIFKMQKKVSKIDKKPDMLKVEETFKDKRAEEVVELDLSDKEMDIVSADTMETVKENCMSIINQIRRDEFGIGVELSEDGDRLMKIQQERLGRSLDRLSKDLYNKDTHFVLELLQNADDNNYPDEFFTDSSDSIPSVKFTVDNVGVTVVNNECGFRENDIRALCDVGRSTKGKHQFGYIGQKGIGFKSVFKITDRPEVHSNGYHICFDVNSGPTGYILPHWLDAPNDDHIQWTTRIFLPFKKTLLQQLRSLAARFNDIRPSLLLFLHRLKHITIDNKVDNTELSITRRDQGNSVIEICHNSEIDRWLVVKKILDASNISLQTKSGVEVQSTEIALAFPLMAVSEILASQVLPPKQPVFAFLPLRSYGLRFIVQGDFDVPSSREDVDRDSPWNQWLRDELPNLFIESLDIFKEQKDLHGLESFISYLQFIPNEDEVMDFFRPFAAQIIQKLKARPCIPTEPNCKGDVYWKLPSQTVIVKDSLIRDVITPEMLQKHLDLYYIHSQVASALNPSLTHTLGIDFITTSHLLHISQAISQAWQTEELTDRDYLISTVAKLFACVYRSLEEFKNNDETFENLKKLKIIPLSSGDLTSLEGQTVFLPPAEFGSERKDSRKVKDPLSELRRELNTINDDFLDTPDHEINSQVEKLLIKLGVRQLMPSDIINHHIMPVLKTDAWKSKSPDVLVCYLVYIKEQMDIRPDLINVDEVIMYSRLVTNHGVKNPVSDSVHFTPAYKNKIDLLQDLPGYNWVLLDNCYISGVSQNSILSWRNFFMKLGVADFLTVKPRQMEYTSEALTDSPWKDEKDSWPSSSEGYVIKDHSSEEFYQLVKVNRCRSSFEKQMKVLFEQFVKDWDSVYFKYSIAQVFDKKGSHLIDVTSSFGMYLQTLAWLPCLEFVMKMHMVTHSQVTSTSEPSQLYIKSVNLESVLGHMVKYLNSEISERNTFCKYLGIKNSTDVETVQRLLCQYAQTPGDVSFSLQHIKSVYRYLFTTLPPFLCQQLFCENSLIFLPDKFSDSFHYTNAVLKGKMVSRDDVWWEDSTGLFIKYQSLLEQFNSGLNANRVIGNIYKDMADMFYRSVQINLQPSLSQYCELLCVMSGALNLADRSTVSDVLNIYSVLGMELQKGSDLIDHGETQTQLAKFTAEKNKLLRRLKTRKLFITKKCCWIGITDVPIISDNKEMERLFFEKENVHFLELEERYISDQRHCTKKGQLQNKMAAIMTFLDLCDTPRLSKLLELQEVTEMLEECSSLHFFFYRLLPIMQLFLFSNYSDIYWELVAADILQLLKEAAFWQTSRLEVKYTLKNNSQASVFRPEKCVITSDYKFYVHKNYVSSYVDINKEIVRMFCMGDADCNKDLRNFLSEICPLLLLENPSSKDIWEILVNHEVEELPVEEFSWKISLPSAYKSQLSPSGEQMDEVWPPPKPKEFCKSVKEIQRDIKSSAKGNGQSTGVGGKQIVSQPQPTSSQSSPHHLTSGSETNRQSNSAVSSPARGPVGRNRGGVFHKRRLDSTGEDVAPAPKRSALQLGLPAWSSTASDYSYEELGKGDNLRVPDNISLEKGAQTEDIGRWGELVVYRYLVQRKNSSQDIVDVLWLNEFEETGLPYDFEVIHLVNNEERSVYVEVKSTVSNNKEVFEISSHELRFAMDKQDQYHVYRLFCAGDAKNVRLIRIENFSLRLDNSEMKLCVVI